MKRGVDGLKSRKNGREIVCTVRFEETPACSHMICVLGADIRSFGLWLVGNHCIYRYDGGMNDDDENFSAMFGSFLQVRLTVGIYSSLVYRRDALVFPDKTLETTKFVGIM